MGRKKTGATAEVDLTMTLTDAKRNQCEILGASDNYLAGPINGNVCTFYT
jgi:hypothetical protein